MKTNALPATTKCLRAWCITTRSSDAAIESIMVFSILAKDKSNSDFMSGLTCPSIASLICSLKKLVLTGTNASCSLAARVTTPLAPTDCHGVLKFLAPRMNSSSPRIR